MSIIIMVVVDLGQMKQHNKKKNSSSHLSFSFLLRKCSQINW